MAKSFSCAAAIAAIATATVATTSLSAEPFNGGYVGIEAGLNKDQSRVSVQNGPTTVMTEAGKSGVGYGGVLGYDMRLPDQIVVGAEAFVNGTTGSMDYPAGDQLKAGRSFGLLARAGLLATPATLVYGTGGWENARFNYKTGSGDFAENRNGWSLGVGLEQMLTPNVSAKVEYRYTRFGQSDFDTLDPVLAGNTKLRDSRNRVLFGVNYRF